MAAVSSKGRLVSDPAISVSDLMAPLKQWMEHTKSQDLAQTLEIPQGINFKSGVNAEWLAKLGPLFQLYAKVAPNSMIPPKKNRSAIMQLNSEGRVNHTRKSHSDFADFIDEALRVAFAQYRQMAQVPEIRERAFRKASPSQVEAIEMALRLLTVGKDSAPCELKKQQSDRSLPSPAGSEKDREFLQDKEEGTVPATSSGVSMVVAQEAACGPTASAAADSKGDCSVMDPSSVFATVLAQPDMQDFDFMAPEDAPQTPAKGKKQLQDDSPLSFEKFIAGSSLQGDIDAGAAKKMVDDAMEVLPLGENGESQLVVFRKAAGKNAKPKAKQVAKAAAKPKKSVRRPAAAPVMAQSSAASKAAADDDGAEAADPVVEVPSHRLSRKQSLTPQQVPHDEPEDAQEETAEPSSADQEKKPKDMSRTACRKRVTSRAWHSTFDRETAKGVPADKAKIKARKAHFLAGQEFDELNPKPGKVMKSNDE